MSVDFGFLREKESEEQRLLCWSSVKGEKNDVGDAGSEKRNLISSECEESSEVH